MAHSDSADFASTPDDLDKLMARVAGGDRNAFEPLYDLVSGPVFGLALRIVRDAAQSEEVMQDVMVEVWRTAGRFRPQRGNARAWIMTVAHRRSVDRVRSAQSSADREVRAARLGAERPFDEVSERVEQRMEQRRVHGCLQRLTEIQRTSVVLAYYNGLTCAEVAQTLSVPQSTVRTRLRDALIRLRDCLGVAS
ncbi:ECF RNA polymerase sigma factor SigK [Streptomyces sp. V4-01]|uniref:ECF RNA polymerase sigma factor SigK n=1 Tax=Actinacidiphila polyblastidii TaxID=3110430 RepID=A0ABU7PB39_9ACTN|nr:ECF RNA polymerase sigma factor SigK [Streptomyces sp. V4-01]